MGNNAAMSRDAVSSPMAHLLLLICQNESRFTYSHELTNLILTQMENALDGKDVHFVTRTNKEKDGEKQQYPDYLSDDYIFKPSEFEDMCFYQTTMSHENKFKIFEQM